VIAFEEALDIIMRIATPLEAMQSPIEAAYGAVLAEDVASDVDLPPFDRAAMDGYALMAEDAPEAGRSLDIVGVVAAGDVFEGALAKGECLRIYTGAPVPEGVDAVVKQESTTPSADGRTVRLDAAARRGENIALRGEDTRAGERVLSAGTRMRSAEVALAAAAGRAEVAVTRRPRVAVLSTGSELVPPGEPVRPGQIRDANGPSLTARLRAEGCETRYLGIASDDRRSIRTALERGLESDCLVVTAGVSVGDRDLVPEVLGELGVSLLFTRVAMKPGKPTTFGTREGSAVFGLPGNPVSALIGVELFCVPYLGRVSGGAARPPATRTGVLTGEITKKAGRRLFAPAVRTGASSADGLPLVEPVRTHGSADLVAHSRAGIIVTVPAQAVRAGPGDEVEIYEFGG